MEPANIRFGGGATETSLLPTTLLAMLLAIVLIGLLPRRYVIAPILLIAFLIPGQQVVVVGGLHFMVLRIIVLLAFARVVWLKVSQGGSFADGFNSVDKAFLLWAFFSTVNFVLLWMEPQALIQRLGFLIDGVCMYLILRFLIRDGQDVFRIIRLFVVIAAIMAVCMTFERVTGHNVFGLLGGTTTPEVRDGTIRAQGVFMHSILAGTCGATLLPLFVGLWKQKVSRITAAIGVLASTIITLTSGSSTPILAYQSGILALCLWPLRHRLRMLRWALVVMLVCLHLVMKAPVWALIARVDLTGSSSSYHRYMLVDNFIRHFGDWWLIGTKDYHQWGWDMWDLCNHYVACGLTGGLISLVFLIAMIALSFKKLGAARSRAEGDRRQEWLMWSLGSALFAHVMAFFGASYWDQSQVAWYALLAVISAATAVRVRQPAEEPALQFVDLPLAESVPDGAILTR